MSKKHKPILIDLDETVFSFAASWDKWMQHTTGQSIDEALYWYYDIDAYIPNFLDKQEEFIKHLPVIKPKPIPEAMDSLLVLSEHFHIKALTARNADEWREETMFWTQKHLPFVTEVHFTREGGGKPPIPKGVMADQLNAFALIDDAKMWIDTLPPHIHGYIVERPDGLASDSGAMSWVEITEDILQKL